MKKTNWWEKRYDEYFYDSQDSLTENQVKHIKNALVKPLIFQAESQAKEEVLKEVREKGMVLGFREGNSFKEASDKEIQEIISNQKI